jgi:AcrR family transcriptional regulator
MARRASSAARVIEFNPTSGKLLSRSEWVKRQPITALGHKIVAATVEEFASKGVQGARVAVIARRAGTTDPTFYRYFPGLRQAALFVMSEYYWAPLNARLNHYRQATDEPDKLLELIVTSLIHSAENDRSRPWLSEAKVFKIVVAESRSPNLLPDSALDAEYVGFLATLEEILKAGQQQKIFNAEFRPALVASLLVNTLHGLLAQTAFGHRGFRVSEDEVRRVARHVVGRL